MPLISHTNLSHILFTLLTGQCAIPCSSGVLYLGGLCESGASTSEVLHLNLFGMYRRGDFLVNDKYSIIAHPPSSSHLSSSGKDAVRYSEMEIDSSYVIGSNVIDCTVQNRAAVSLKPSAISTSTSTIAEDKDKVIKANLIEKWNNTRNLEYSARSRSYHFTEAEQGLGLG